MSSNIPSNKNEQTIEYIAEIRSLHKQGKFSKVLWMLEVFKQIPKELHSIAVDTILRTAVISPFYYKAGLKYLTWKSKELPLNGVDRERLLSTFLDIATDPDHQEYLTGNLRELANIDDPRVFKLLVTLYQTETSPERKKEIVYALGTGGKENALPILLDYIHQHKATLPGIGLGFLEKYPVSERSETFQRLAIDDRDTVVAEFTTFLQNGNNHNDEPRTAMAYVLAILHASHLTSFKSKELIETSANTAICYGYDEYSSGPTGYIYLKEFMQSNEDGD